jgi:hypothetical protein
MHFPAYMMPVPLASAAPRKWVHFDIMFGLVVLPHPANTGPSLSSAVWAVPVGAARGCSSVWVCWQLLAPVQPLTQMKSQLEFVYYSASSERRSIYAIKKLESFSILQVRGLAAKVRRYIRRRYDLPFAFCPIVCVLLKMPAQFRSLWVLAACRRVWRLSGIVGYRACCRCIQLRVINQRNSRGKQQSARSRRGIFGHDVDRRWRCVLRPVRLHWQRHRS